MLLRSKTNYECTILQAVNKHAVTGTIMTLCHSGYEEEANEVMMNLVTLCKGRFGKKNDSMVHPGYCRRINRSNV